MRIFVALFVLVQSFVYTYADAQTHSLRGSVNDATDNSALISAIVSVAPARDTTKVILVATDVDGKFQFDGLKKGTYQIKVSYIGYEPLVRYLRMDSTDKNIGSLKMTSTSTTLKGVTVVEKVAHVEQKGDTSQYNASTFKTNPDATAEDLVTKMPGISSENGTVKAHGETVQKVLVDGKEYFGDDATTALKNMPAEVVDKVQVFDRMNDQSSFTGFDDGNSQKTLNITTKKGRNNGVFGKLYGGYGYLTDSRYSAGGVLNWFNGDRRISLIGMSNDINQQNFASQDLLGITGGGSGGRGGGGGGRGPGGGGRPGGGGGDNSFAVGQTGGISTTHSLGLNYTDVWGKKKNVKITGSYFFNLTDNVSSTSLTRKYFNSGDTATYYKEDNSTSSRNQNHRINLRLEYVIDSMNSLIITPKLSYQQNTQQNNIYGQNLLGLTDPISSTKSDYHASNSGYNISGDVLYQHKFPDRYKTFSIDIGTVINNKVGTSTQKAISIYSLLNDSVLLDQQTASSSKSYNINANVSFTEAAGKQGMVQFNYSPAYTWNMADKEADTLNRSVNLYNLLDTSLSNKYNSDYMVQKAGFSYRFRNDKINMMIGLNGQFAQLTGHNDFPLAYNTSKNFLNVLPMAMFNYKFKNQTNLRIFYRTSTTPPTIAQLQSVVDNSNPLLLSTGNPNLRQSFNNNVFIRYGFTDPKKGQSAFIFASVNNTIDYVANATLIAGKDTTINGDVLLRKGSQLTLPVNINGNWAANMFLTYGQAISAIKCNLNINAGMSYSRVPSLVNNALNISNTYAPTAGVTLSSNISENIDFTIGYNGTYNIVENSLQTASNNNYYSHTANVKFNWQFWKGFVFNTSAQNVLYAGVSQGYNQNIILWNASLAYKFLKDKSLELKAGVNDILNQNSGISRTVNQTYIEDSRNQVLKRYLLVTVTYTLRYYKKPAGYGSN